MDDKINLNTQIGDGENESPIIPKSPEPKIDLRTLESDLKEIQESGGQTFSGYQPQTNQTNQTPTEQNLTQTQTTNQPTLSTEEKIPSEPNIAPAPTLINEQKNPKNKTWLIVLVLVIVFILLGYFVIYPKFFSTQKETLNQNNIPTTPPPPPPQPEIEPINQIPTQNLPPAPENLPQNEPNQNKPSTLNLKTIESYKSFSKKPNTVSEIILSFLTLEDFKNALPKEDVSAINLKEIIIKNQNNQILNFKTILNLLVPDFFDDNILSQFDDNLNLFKYINNKGNWLIFVLKLKDNISPNEIKTLMDQMANLQKSKNLTNLFLENPGEMKAWQDGKVKNQPTSLVNFEKDGATVSYTWFNKYLLLSTNLEGAEKVAENLDY